MSEGMGSNKLEIIKNRFPEPSEIFLALGMALFLIHSWSLRMFFFRVPSFLLYMGLDQIGAVLAYMMAFALLESLLVTIILIVIAAILPSNWLKIGFGYKTFIILLVSAVGSYYIQKEIGSAYPGIKRVLIWAGEIAFPMVFLLLLAGYIKPFKKVCQFIVEQISVMVYIYLPIGLLSLVIVAFRLIF